MLTTHLHLVPKSVTRGAILPLPNTPFWRGAQLKHKYNFAFNFTFTHGWKIWRVQLLKSQILFWHSTHFSSKIWWRRTGCRKCYLDNTMRPGVVAETFYCHIRVIMFRLAHSELYISPVRLNHSVAPGYLAVGVSATLMNPPLSPLPRGERRTVAYLRVAASMVNDGTRVALYINYSLGILC
jgi:hypothetical protein